LPLVWPQPAAAHTGVHLGLSQHQLHPINSCTLLVLRRAGQRPVRVGNRRTFRMAAHINFDLDDAYEDAGYAQTHRDGARPLARLGSGTAEPLCGVVRSFDDVTTFGDEHGSAAELCRKLVHREVTGWAAVSRGDLVGVVKVTGHTAAAVVVSAAGHRSSLTAKAVATTACAQRLCEGLLRDGALKESGAGAWCVACAAPAHKLEPCAGRGCAAILCPRCQTVQKRCPSCQGKATTRRTILRRWARESERRPALEALASAFGHFSVDGSVARDAFPSLVVASLGPDASYDDDDDVVLRDAFDACDSDGDGLVDLHDVVNWLTKASQRMQRDRATIALARSPKKDDRASFAAWPEKRGALLLNNDEVDADLGGGRLVLSLRNATARVLALHPAVCRVERRSDVAFSLTCSVGEAEEVLHFSTQDASSCKAWWTSIGETLAVHRRLKSEAPVSADSFDDIEEAEDEVDAIEASAGTTSTFHAIASALGALGQSTRPPVAMSTPAKAKWDPPATPLTVGGKSALRRKSVRFSDADETHVSRGFAFDRVVRRDGTVSWEAATPRRAKAAWRTVVRLVIRPPRASYAIEELGPLSFDIPLLDGKTAPCVRSDFSVQSDEKKQLKCSLWCRAFGENAPCVLYLHGNASCRLEALPHIAPLLILGISVCAVDTTGSGSSEGEFVTLGLREAADASAVAAHLIANQRATRVALYGRSMGAVAAILAGARKAGFSSQGVAPCVVADSPFASLSQLVDSLARNAAHAALGCECADIKKGERPIDDDFIRDVQEGRSEQTNKVNTSYFPSRAGLAESAAKAAVDAVRAEVLNRAALDVDDVDALRAVEVLEAPLLLVAATDDQLMPPRANAGALLRRYASKGCRRRDAELLLVKGGHNSRRPLTCVLKTYAFLARHLLGDAFDQRRVDRLDAVRGKLAAASPPWAYVANRAPAKGRGAEFRSGMTDARAKQMGRDISNVFSRWG